MKEFLKNTIYTIKNSIVLTVTGWQTFGTFSTCLVAKNPGLVYGNVFCVDRYTFGSYH